ncbi:MAG: transposase [Treponema sp.]|jgi:hypothetical protein|nr:transposase [Treponema sp.]
MKRGGRSLYDGRAPLWTASSASQRRTRQDFAGYLQDLARTHYPEAEKIVLVIDNLNTHTLDSLYEPFHPREERELAERFEIHRTPTPKHGSLAVYYREYPDQTPACISKMLDFGED